MEALQGLIYCFIPPEDGNWAKKFSKTPSPQDLYKEAVIEPPNYESNSTSTTIKSNELLEVKLKHVVAVKKEQVVVVKDTPHQKRSLRPKKRPRRVVAKVPAAKKEDDRKRKLRRKAELARENRRRKKERIDELELEIPKIEEEIRKEMEFIQMVAGHGCHAGMNSSKDRKDARASQKISSEMHKKEEQRIFSALECLEARCPQEAVANVKNLFSVSVKRQKCTDFHFQACLGTSRLCPPVRFLVWALTQPANFYLNPSSIWHSLISQKLGMSKAQVSMLSTLQPLCLQIGQQVRCIEGVMRNGARAAVPRGPSLMSLETTCVQKIRNIMTSSQWINFCVWAHQNELTIDMLVSSSGNI
uniref:Uncharacterized protein n=1 Tax=Lotharella oceanica TaxID=641309 RepID=A0A7S2THU8_9EUKA|mmetsp:Transcript_13231/g.25333  ORF Transcript_13231/g.25333 Transcript_13231/m.25333 type:complete len:359 (+) Transcript_13231:78-1154(+)|eukprot:CAMPEP_0170167724 /NCGR_PEP_ID=MMETSP0040_2-20121228/1046_1 /TAXON_ID=641309 /ORGANISM="Lotharella oceanica, Strain CCMP622" /LENGTH=358 /DNA_ID=CAMNT_0010405837 /DNA_START=66 /DNA_END=1142 /DNA_ORIENTATION=+